MLLLVDPTSYIDREEFRDTVQKEAVEELMKWRFGTANITMRLGKTLIGLRIAERFDRVLVAYPNLSILESWKSDADKFKIDIKHIDFTTYRSLHKYNLNHYDVVILDELHDISEKQWETIGNQLQSRIYGLTGTPPLRGIKNRYLEKLCPVRYTKTLYDTTGITNKDYQIFVHLLKPSTSKNILLKSSGRFWSEADKISFFNKKYEERRDFSTMLTYINTIKNSQTKFSYLRKLVTQRKRCIVFVETTEQCKAINLLSYHSKESESRQNLELFQNKVENKLVTINQLKQGITFPELSSCIILHAYASNNRASQKIGRCLNYVEGDKAIIDILCLKGTRDEYWVKSALADFDNDKITYLEVDS